MTVVQIIDLVFRLIQLAILARVLYSWVDPSPYPTNELKRVLWALTDPILEPLRRLIPPLGMFDITPLVALVLVNVLRSIIVGALDPMAPLY